VQKGSNRVEYVASVKRLYFLMHFVVGPSRNPYRYRTGTGKILTGPCGLASQLAARVATRHLLPIKPGWK
jgi:hypothetical protein